jgi:DNA invertase Pin-like site-specific DNA recombinase
MGHTIVEVYADNGISGAMGRDKRRRSLQDLAGFLEHLRETKIHLFLHQQGLDTATSSGRAMFGMLSVFSEFERAIIRERVVAGIARAKAKGTKSGKPIGRPDIHPARRAAIRAPTNMIGERTQVPQLLKLHAEVAAALRAE